MQDEVEVVTWRSPEVVERDAGRTAPMPSPGSRAWLTEVTGYEAGLAEGTGPFGGHVRWAKGRGGDCLRQRTLSSCQWV